jgi:hypothetical protein
MATLMTLPVEVRLEIIKELIHSVTEQLAIEMEWPVDRDYYHEWNLASAMTKSRILLGPLAFENSQLLEEVCGQASALERSIKRAQNTHGQGGFPECTCRSPVASAPSIFDMCKEVYIMHAQAELLSHLRQFVEEVKISISEKKRYSSFQYDRGYNINCSAWLCTNCSTYKTRWWHGVRVRVDRGTTFQQLCQSIRKPYRVGESTSYASERIMEQTAKDRIRKHQGGLIDELTNAVENVRIDYRT